MEDLGKTLHALGNISPLYSRLPLVDMPVLQEVTPYYFDWLGHPSRDEFWRSISIEDRHASVRVPALNVGG